MDPNKLLERIRQAIESYHANGDEFHRGWTHEEEFVEDVEALDEWLSKGGFTPDAWAVRGR